jgi:hypothetical protein
MKSLKFFGRVVRTGLDQLYVLLLVTVKAQQDDLIPETGEMAGSRMAQCMYGGVVIL